MELINLDQQIIRAMKRPPLAGGEAEMAEAVDGALALVSREVGEYFDEWKQMVPKVAAEDGRERTIRRSSRLLGEALGRRRLELLGERISLILGSRLEERCDFTESYSPEQLDLLPASGQLQELMDENIYSLCLATLAAEIGQSAWSSLISVLAPGSCWRAIYGQFNITRFFFRSVEGGPLSSRVRMEEMLEKRLYGILDHAQSLLGHHLLEAVADAIYRQYERPARYLEYLEASLERSINLKRRSGQAC